MGGENCWPGLIFLRSAIRLLVSVGQEPEADEEIEMTTQAFQILVDDNGPTNGFRFEAELVGGHDGKFVFGFGDCQEEALFSIALKLGFDDLGDMKYETVQRGEF